MSQNSTETEVNEGKKTTKHILTPLEAQQEKLDKLFKKIDTPVYIPAPTKPKTHTSQPKDFIRNVSGSSAGAGSGDFHVYRAQRRREYARMKHMDDQELKEKEDNEYREKLARLREQDEERTAKKRAKRQKRNNKVKLSSTTEQKGGNEAVVEEK